MNKLIYFIAIFICSSSLYAQDDLMSILEGNEGEDKSFVSATFKSTRLINGHSIEVRPEGTLEFIISHRFGRINGGIDEFYGLDDSQVRIALEYGLSDKLNVGLGRSSFSKTVDGFLKYKFLRQGNGAGSAPISLVGYTEAAIRTGKGAFTDPTRDNKFAHRMGYAVQLLAARKVNSNFSLQIMPTLIHRNIVLTKEDKNDILAIGIGGRHKLTNRLALNAEYYYQVTDNPGTHNMLALGFDIETGGHVFQLHFTNTRSMITRGFVSETDGSWGDGDIQFGFNISRVFNLKEPK